ncbi:MAG: hypothetical protein JNK53_03645 [Phycisphaerae bacterium]|nr:hypothetical protein [Phycisphaerae bacterium]
MPNSRAGALCSAVALAVSLALVGSGEAAAQAKPASTKPVPPRLQLDAPPSAVPPPLPAQHAVAALARQVRAEIQALEPRVVAPGGAARLDWSAQLAFRRLAFDLLFHGAGAEDQAMAVAGIRLASCRDALDQLLQQPLTDDPTGTAVRADLSAFVAGAAQGLHPLPPAGAPEVELATLLLPLRRAVCRLENRADAIAPDAWPSLAGASTAAQSNVLDALDVDAEASHARANATLREALDASKWLTPTERDAWHAMLDGPAARDVELASALNSFLRNATALMRGEGTWDAVRMRAAASAIAQQPNAAAVRSLAALLASAQFVRAFDLSTIAPHLRVAARDIQLQARRSSVKLAPLLPAIAVHSSVATDPNLGSAVDAQVGTERDLGRIRAASAWPDRLAAVRAGSREPFDRVVRAWVAALVVPQQRTAARIAMDEFARQLALVAPVRLEARIRMGDAAAVQACGGRSQELLAEIDRRRDAWAAAWCRASGGTAAESMLRAVRVMDALAAVSAFEAKDGVESTLSCWGGFFAPRGGLGVHPQALNARAQLAVEALIAGKDDAVDAHLAALKRDVPVAWLAALAAETLQPWLAARGGVLAQLDAACSGPRRDSWLGSERAQLMLFARYAHEEAALTGAADAELADAIRTYLAELARGITARAN